jgi:carbonic anhydrase/acetyltransferase-like protein (isoleucine patch superfamily)
MPHGSTVALAGNAPRVAADAWIAPGAFVIGQVRLGSRSSVWYGAVLRADDELIEVGPGSNIQDNCVLHADAGIPTLIGADVTIGHNAIVHGARVGNGVLIGMNAVLLNGCVIGDGCVIGASAVVPEGMTVPARSLVLGLPGRVRRELSDDEVAHNLTSARGYQARAERHRSQAQPATGSSAADV